MPWNWRPTTTCARGWVSDKEGEWTITIATARVEGAKTPTTPPAVRPIAVRLVYEVVEAINKLPAEKRVPVIAIGGVATWEDAVEFIMAGASAIQVGTATFANPNAMVEIIDGLSAFMKCKGYHNIEEMRGIIQK